MVIIFPSVYSRPVIGLNSPSSPLLGGEVVAAGSRLEKELENFRINRLNDLPVESQNREIENAAMPSGLEQAAIFWTEQLGLENATATTATASATPEAATSPNRAFIEIEFRLLDTTAKTATAAAVTSTSTSKPATATTEEEEDDGHDGHSGEATATTTGPKRRRKPHHTRIFWGFFCTGIIMTLSGGGGTIYMARLIAQKGRVKEKKKTKTKEKSKSKSSSDTERDWVVEMATTTTGTTMGTTMA